MGLGRFELPTSRLSGVRSNHLSYKPIIDKEKCDVKLDVSTCPDKSGLLLRKEVIQPHLPVRLPCYDFAPVIRLTFDISIPDESGFGKWLRVLPTSMA